ncbi:MAG: hypothetical protein JST36_02035 [Bacteroidetes bacterium]|nr:hypothetical protein [Bacteroidota bacterium]
MFLIRNKQLQAFDWIQPKRFQNKMLKHLATYYPEQSAILGKAGLLKLIAVATEQFQSFRIKTYYEGCIFLEAIVGLGLGFASDPAYAQLQEKVLHPKSGFNGKLVDAIHHFRKEYQAKTLKKDELFPDDLIRKIRTTTDEDFEDMLKLSNDAEVVQLFLGFWPEKVAQAPQASWAAFIEAGREKAKEFGMISTESTNFFIFLQFVFGHRFFEDPQYDWFSELLTDPEYADDYYKYCSLYFTLQKYFEALVETDNSEKD